MQSRDDHGGEDPGIGEGLIRSGAGPGPGRRRTLYTAIFLISAGLLLNVPLLQYMLRPDGIRLSGVLTLFVTLGQAAVLSAGVITLASRKVLGRRSALTWIAAVPCLALAGATLEVLARSLPFYRYALASDKPGWMGSPFQADPVYGLVNRPSAEAWEMMPGRPPNPVAFDAEGFRIPDGADPLSHPPDSCILFLGCSFTFGSGVTAEEAFPGLVGARTGLPTINGGVCSWGVSQMLRRAEEMIPSMRPSCLVFQYSPWLISRTIRGFAPVYFGVLPTPYYSLNGSGSVEFCEPPFASEAISLELDSLSGREPGVGGYLSFLADAALPLFIHDDVSLLWFRLREITGSAPRRLDDPRLIARHSYGSISRLCGRYGVDLVILRISNTEDDPCWEDVLGALDSGTVISDGEAALWNSLPERTVAGYRRSYWTWAGVPPRVVNSHPNALAHSIIADCIVEAAGFGLRPTTGAAAVSRSD